MRISDWSSDVCSSDLPNALDPEAWRDLANKCGAHIDEIAPGLACRVAEELAHIDANWPTDRKSVVSGQSVSVRVDLGDRRIIKKKNSSSHRTQFMIAQEQLVSVYTKQIPIIFLH